MFTTADWVQIALLAVAAITLIIQLRNSARAQAKSEAELKSSLDARLGQIGMDLHGLQITVSPYAQQIRDIEEQQAHNTTAISKLQATLEAKESDINRLERLQEGLQARFDTLPKR